MTPNVIAAALPEEIDALNARYGEVEQMCAQVWHIVVDFQKHVAKLGQRITESTQPDDFPNILTRCTDDKMQDDFIGVHICKKITCDDIVEVRAPEEYSQLDENENDAILDMLSAE